jgi:L-iditol 2-dehydrogenase
LLVSGLRSSATFKQRSLYVSVNSCPCPPQILAARWLSFGNACVASDREVAMRAACLVRPGVVEVHDFEAPEPAEGQVTVEMRYSSICGSDVHVVFDGLHNPEQIGKAGYPGHEGVGVVAASRSAGFPVGTPVLTVPPGRRGACFAEYQAVDETNLVALPPNADLRRLLLAQQLGTTIFAMKKFVPAGLPETPRTVAILGAGSAGLFFLQQVLRLGCETVVVSELNSKRLAVAARLGAHHTVHLPNESVSAAVDDLTGGVGVDLVIEAAGYDRCRAEAVEVVKTRGTIGFFGYPERVGSAPFPVDQAFRKSLTMEWISGTQQEPGLASFRSAVDLIHCGAVEVDYCLERMFPLEQTPIALETARRQGNGFAKVGIVLPSATGDRSVEETSDCAGRKP